MSDEKNPETKKSSLLSRRVFVTAAAATAGAAVGGGLRQDAEAGPVGKYSTPTLACAGATANTVFLTVCAGATGAPAGFSVQWQPLPPDTACGDFVWPSSDSLDLCKASLSGVPGCSIYNLAANACVTLEIGNLNDAECGVGLSNCGANELECGTTYVFRAFAHANSKKNRSDFTANQCCTTLDCEEEEDGCVLSQGYWRTHACDWPEPFAPGAPGTALAGQCGLNGNDPNTSCACDAVNTLNIGSIAYNQCQLLCALTRVGQGNALVILAHQLIAAELNRLNGAPQPPDCSLADAHALIGSRNILTDSVGTQTTLGHQMTDAAHCLDLYNTGDGGVPHCAEDA